MRGFVLLSRRWIVLTRLHLGHVFSRVWYMTMSRFTPTMPDIILS